MRDFSCFPHAKKIAVTTLFAATIGSATGCASYRDITSDKSPRDIATFETRQTFSGSQTAESWPDTHWSRAFGDAQLNALIDEALAKNPSLDMALARIRAAQAFTGTARAAQSPNINATGNFQWERLSENGLFPPPIGGSFDSNNTVRLNISYELDFWGKQRNAVRAAVSQQRAAEAEYASARLVVSNAVAKTYVALSRLYAQRDVIEQTLQQRQRIYALTEQRVKAGLDTRAELKQAEEQLPALRGQLAQTDEDIGAVRNALAELLGAGPDRGQQITRPQLAVTTDVSLPANLPAQLLGRRPDIVAARWRVEASSYDVDVAKSQFYPNVNLSAFAGLNSLGLSDLVDSGSKVYGYGPAITLPIFAGGQLRHNLNGKYAAYDAAVADYGQTLTAALREIADQLNAMHWLERRATEQRAALAIAQEALDLATQRYRAGLGNYISVLNAQSQVLAQEQAGVELGARAVDIRLDLIKALGGGFNADADSNSNSDTNASANTAHGDQQSTFPQASAHLSSSAS